jgi:type II secretory pathway component PulF
VIGVLAKLYNATQFSRTLALTLNAGITLREGLTITQSVTRNVRYAGLYTLLEKNITKGEPLFTTLVRHTHLFPETFPHMIETAENSGSLAQTLSYLSEFYETEIDDRVRILSNSLEPLLLLVMGLTVGLVAVAVITPIYEITRSMQSY